MRPAQSTFSELWYRVADLRPRLRAGVSVQRRSFRGELWYVLQDPAANDFFRIHPAAYRFVASMDGQRTVGQMWRDCNQQLGDEAPTQGEVIQLLGQLYTSNLLQADIPPDTESVLLRHRRRARQRVQGQLANVLFVRIPLLDPDRFLERWSPFVGHALTPYGLAAWAAVMALGLYFVVARAGELFDRASGVLSPANLPLLYLAVVVSKVFHEFGHGFACKKFGAEEGTGGEVHTMGVMFRVFVPLPYVDASSAWALRSRWARVVTSLSGMMVELGLAGVAAVVWANSAQGSPVHSVCYNIMFVASVSTVLFNANPLMRFDGYYVLSDLLEIPNLGPRSREYLYYLVRRYAWGVRGLSSPAHGRWERKWLLSYCIASTAYRTLICAAIIVFVAGSFFFVGVALAAMAVVGWVLTPLARFVNYLLVSPELARTRARAVWSTAAFLALVLTVVGVARAPDYCRVEGIVEAQEEAVVYAAAAGFVTGYLRSGSPAEPDGAPLVTASNPELEALLQQVEAERRAVALQRRLAEAQDTAVAQVFEKQIQALDRRIEKAQSDLAALALSAPMAGTWLSPGIDRLTGAFVRRGEPVGRVVDLRDPVVRAVAGQQTAARIISERRPAVRIRARGRPDVEYAGTVLQVLPAGTRRLSAEALGYAAGGSVGVEQSGGGARRAVENVFEVLVRPEMPGDVPPVVGQRVVVRFELGPKPLLSQWGQALLRLFQRRLRV
jgi:putative peptide zinc metalloprotease protein